MSDEVHVALWNDCLAIIKNNIAESTYNTWFAPIIPLKYEDKTLVIQVPSQFFYEFLEEKFVDLLRQTLYEVIGEGAKLMYNVMVDRSSSATVNLEASNRTNTPPNMPKTGNNNRFQSNNVPHIIQQPKPQVMESLDARLNADYTFESFIEGNSNKLSRSVAEAVANDPAKTVFNPLFVHGSSGVGKTHLANAIGLRIKEKFPEKRVLYVSAHLFQVQYTDSVRNNTTNDFINFYQTIDVLIIDDIQEFAGVVKTQNTFFHIFNHLHQNSKQLILTSDTAPSLLQGMEDRLLTRFKWGMVAELEKPTIELRKNILKNKIKRDGLLFPEDAILYIAENVDDSVRDLEGIVISVMAHSTIYNKDIDLDLVKRIVNKNKVLISENRTVSIDQILNVTSKYFNIEAKLIHSKSRKKEVVQARHTAMYLAKQLTEYSTPKIGKLVGNRNHSTVIHACKTVEKLMDVDKTYKKDIEAIKNDLFKR